MQGKSLKNWDASKSQALPVFGVGVAFIDESIFSLNPSDEIEKAIEEIRSVVSKLTPPHKELHIIPIENICSSSENGSSRLNELLEMITDATGKDDFLHYLRMLSFQKVLLSITDFIFPSLLVQTIENVFTWFCCKCLPDCFGQWV